MILHPISLSDGPETVNVLFGAILWLMGTFLIMFHRSGIQLLGLIIIGIGSVLLIFHSRVFLAVSLIGIGVILHGFGRILYYLRRRD